MIIVGLAESVGPDEELCHLGHDICKCCFSNFIKILPQNMNFTFCSDWRSTQIVANLVLFLRQFANSIFSLNSRQILVNKVSNDWQYNSISYYEEKFMIFYDNSEILSKKQFRFRIIEKNTSPKWTNFGELQNKVPISQWFSI